MKTYVMLSLILGIGIVSARPGSFDRAALQEIRNDGQQALNETATPPGNAMFVFSTYFGGNRRSSGDAIAVDKEGFVYIAGRTQARNFPKVKPVQKRYGGGVNDAYVVKLTPDGQNIVYSTLLGGLDVDFATGVAIDDSGNAYIAGITYSQNFPTTRDAFQRKFGGGDRDGFVVKLSADGALVYSTLLGGDMTDRCSAIDVDAAGNAYVTGSTNSQNFAAPRWGGSKGAQKDWDVLVAKLDASGSRLLFGTRFGGSAGTNPGYGQWGGEAGSSIKAGANNTIYVAGGTDSSDFPIRKGLQPRFGGGKDGFIVRLRATDAELLAGTYLGGAANDGISAMALDRRGNVYVTGTTEGVNAPKAGPALGNSTFGNFPLRNALQPQRHALMSSAFVAKLNAELAEIDYSTYVGGNMIERGYGIAADRLGNAYIIGTSQSRDFPLVRPLQFEPSLQDALVTGSAFITKISATGGELLFSTLLGTLGSDTGSGIAVDASGDIYVTGQAGYGGNWTYPEFPFPTFRAIQPERGNKTFQTFVCRIRP